MKFKAKDIAEELGISTATVSLVINGKPNVGEETRKNVIDLIKAKGYDVESLIKPSSSANKSLIFVIFKKHGKVVSDTPFFNGVIEGANREAGSMGYTVVVMYVDEKKDNIQQMCNQLNISAPAGILFLGTELDKNDLWLFKEIKLPLLLLDSYFFNENTSSVVINNRQGAYQATSLLAEYGHKEIGYLHSSVNINNFQERFEGFKMALHNQAIKYHPEYIFLLESTTEGSYRDMKKLLQDREGFPTAFFADNDIIATGAMRAMKEAGINIPEDVSVIGFDDMPVCEILDPPLSTVRVNKSQMGAVAVRQLDYIISHPTAEHLHVEVNTSLVIRNSLRTV